MCQLSSPPGRHQVLHNDATMLLSYSRNHKPFCTIDSGEEVTFDNTSAGFNKITISTNDADLVNLGIKDLTDVERCIGPIYVNGPVYINNAAPGDILKVDVLELQTGPWGWTAIFPGLGLLQDEIVGPHIKTFDLTKDKIAFKPGITIPRQPFYGMMGVAPADDVELSPVFPRNDIGGNFDCRYLTQGATLYLPVNVPGALFAVGDAHYCQGDGEITGVALETTMKSRLRFTIIKDKQSLKSPHYDVSLQWFKDMHSIGGMGEHGVMATAPTRNAATKEAVRGLLDWLREEKRLTRTEGYMLLSLCGSLKTIGDYGLGFTSMSASIPLAIFDET